MTDFDPTGPSTHVTRAGKENEKKKTMWKLAFHIGGDIKTVLECGSEYSGLHQTLVPQGNWLQVVQGEREKSTVSSMGTKKETPVIG